MAGWAADLRMDDLIAAARPTLARVVELLRQHSIKVTPLPDAFIGVGAAVGWSDLSFCVVSVAAGGNESIVNLTIGVIKDVQQDRLTVLDACNRLTRDNAAYPYFLHDAEAGWDVLLQVRLPLGVVVNSSEYFLALVHQLPAMGVGVRNDLQSVLGGTPYGWSDADLNRLLLRSLL